jgi:hypothetical protein
MPKCNEMISQWLGWWFLFSSFHVTSLVHGSTFFLTHRPDNARKYGGWSKWGWPINKEPGLQTCAICSRESRIKWIWIQNERPKVYWHHYHRQTITKANAPKSISWTKATARLRNWGREGSLLQTGATTSTEVARHKSKYKNGSVDIARLGEDMFN